MAIAHFGGILDSKTFHQYENQAPTLRARNKNIALLASNHPTGADPYIRSLAISDAGIITSTPIDELRPDTEVLGRDPGLIHWHEDVFVAYFNDAPEHGHLWTIACNDAGIITDSPLDYLRIADSVNMTRRSMLFKPHPHVLLTGAAGAIDSATCQTVILTDSGEMPPTVTESLFVPIRPSCQCFRQGAGDRILNLAPKSAVYQLYSFTCTDGGVLSDSPTDTWADIETLSDRSPLCKITDSFYAVLFRDTGGACNIHTFSINPDGTINKTWIDSEEVDPSSNGHFHMIEMGAGYFLLVHKPPDDYWTLKTYFIAADGTIQDGAIDSMTIPTVGASNSWLEYLGDNIWTLTYQAGSKNINVDTFLLEAPSITEAHNELTIGIGP